MPMLTIDRERCIGCMLCIEACPFGALVENNGEIEITAACRMCSVCVKQCPAGAIQMQEVAAPKVDKSAWKGILIFGECTPQGVHPVVTELIGKAQELVAAKPQPVSCVLVGAGCTNHTSALNGLGLEELLVYDDEKYAGFIAHIYADVLEAAINELKPSIVLIGATTIGRSLAPRVAARFRTGLTADCTVLELRENSDLVQIRPAFGGDIMAQILTPNTRPQFATVRYKVMSPAVKVGCAEPKVKKMKIPANSISALAEVISNTEKSLVENISEAEIIVAAGRGLKSQKDLELVQVLADALGAQLAGTRPTIEAGWLPYTRQIGLSGRTVRPRLIITCGISGAVQFTACMRDSDCIIAINTDREAPIFKIAHYGIVGDLYHVIPQLIEGIKKQKAGETYEV